MAKDTTLEALDGLQESTVELVARIAVKIEELRTRKAKVEQDRVERLARTLPVAVACWDAMVFGHRLERMARGTAELEYPEVP